MRQRAASRAKASPATTRLSGSWLILARTVWWALVIPSLGLFVISLPVYDQDLQRVDGCGCLDGGLRVEDLQSLAAQGFSVSAYAAVLTGFVAIIVAIWCAVGFLLFWRRSDDWLALLAALFLVMLGLTLTTTSSLAALELTAPILAGPIGLVDFLGQASLITFALFFPNGRQVPRWMGLILPLCILNAFFDTFPSPLSPFNATWPGWFYGLLYCVFTGAVLFSQLYRYRRISTLIQRQQTKWVIFGIILFVGVFFGLLLLNSLPSLSNTLFLNEAWALTLPLASLAIPLSIGFSILRYRLYDIDTLINKALVYGLLTGLLAALYSGLILGLESLAGLVMGQEAQPLVIVVSTLVIAALFLPVRRRIQASIDRRFYRKKYDAEQMLAAFSATLRHEVDLE